MQNQYSVSSQYLAIQLKIANSIKIIANSIKIIANSIKIIANSIKIIANRAENCTEHLAHRAAAIIANS